MSRKGTKTITFDEGEHERIKMIAERNGLGIKEAVLKVFSDQFPNDFPERLLV